MLHIITLFSLEDKTALLIGHTHAVNEDALLVLVSYDYVHSERL